MIKRPKRGDDEEDILKMQEDFFREKARNVNHEASAKVTNLSENLSINSDSIGRKPSKFAQFRRHHIAEKQLKLVSPIDKVHNDLAGKNVLTNPTEIDDDKVYYPKLIPQVMGEIREKNIDRNFTELTESAAPSTGFPTVSKCNLELKGSTSLFAMHILSKKTNSDTTKSEQMNIDVEVNSTAADKECVLNIPNKSYIVTSDADLIHEENVQRLSKLSEKDILLEQQKLLKDLDPSLVQFIKSKRKDLQFPKVGNEKHLEDKRFIHLKGVDQPMKAPEMSFDVSLDGQLQDTDNIHHTTEDCLWENDVLSHPNINQWLHFDSLEKDKLEWIKDIHNSKIHSDAPYEARFNFNGYLLPYTFKMTDKTKPLFHHGEEPHRPGYSLVELIELSRSSILQQRVMALNTIAGILEYYTIGTYKNILELPVTKLFFVVRFSVDENKHIVLEPALKAMRNLFYHKVDEACLDALIGTEEGLIQPCLENDKSEIDDLESKESELKDFHLAEIDLVTGILRTDILQRIFYILNTIKPSFNCVQYCLQILTRIARNSVETSAKLLDNEDIMTCIIKNFVPKTSVNFTFEPQILYNEKPILAALKLFRVLSLQSKEISSVLFEKYKLLDPISVYITSGVDGTYGLRIQMESFAILINFLQYNIGRDVALSLSPILITSLYKHVNGTDIYLDTSVVSVTHAAILIQLIKKLLVIYYEKNMDAHKLQIYPLIRQGLLKWVAQLAMSEKYSSAHLRLLGAVFDCAKVILQKDPAAMNGLTDSLRILASSRGFKYLLTQMESSSNLLSNIESKDFFSLSNLVSLKTTMIDSVDKVVPVLKFESPFAFLVSLFRVLYSIGNMNVSNIFVDHMWNYLLKLSSCEPRLCDHWFTRVETDFLLCLLKVAVTKEEIAEPQRDLLYLVSNMLCYILRVDKKNELGFLFNEIVFNNNWFTTQRLINLLSVTDSDNCAKTLHSISDIKTCYSMVANLSFNFNNNNIVYRHWQQPILPRDWIYLPIINLYSKNQEYDSVNSNRLAINSGKEAIITCSLEWILFNEICFADLLKDIDLTDRFCRLMCVFLCDNSTFLDSKINMLLKKIIQIIFMQEKHSNFNFDKDLIGINNFQDFYTQLLEQFQAVSYGDSVFASCVLVPIAQKHNAKWRKLLWSEYAGCLRALDCPEQYLSYNIDEYLYPVETEESILNSYQKALSTNLLRTNTIVYKIAIHHTNHYSSQFIH